LRPGARALSPALRDATVLAPEAEALFGDLDRLVSVSREGVPATTRVVRGAHPLFKLLPTTLQEAQPVVDYLGLYKEDLVIQLANFSSQLQATAPAQSTGEQIHYLRALVPFLPEGLLVNQERIGSNRFNPYGRPDWLRGFAKGLESFACTHTGNPGPPGQFAPPCVEQEQVAFQDRTTGFTQVRRGR
ncbi:MAG: hypothetical protein M3340_02485, partial [Actinomycetota bacterium]|nr:hypothetical protein [Actinomycetota bacterium]